MSRTLVRQRSDVRPVDVRLTDEVATRARQGWAHRTDLPESSGLLLMPPEELAPAVTQWLALVRLCVGATRLSWMGVCSAGCRGGAGTWPSSPAQGYQVNTHAIGDLANQLVLDAYENATLRVVGRADPTLRLQIEHAQVLVRRKRCGVCTKATQRADRASIAVRPIGVTGARGHWPFCGARGPAVRAAHPLHKRQGLCRVAPGSRARPGRVRLADLCGARLAPADGVRLSRRAGEPVLRHSRSRDTAGRQQRARGSGWPIPGAAPRRARCSPCRGHRACSQRYGCITGRLVSG